MTEREFVPWPKVPRLNRDIVVTEKIDGTNAAVVITEDDIYAQSRTRIITPGKQTDNYGFAAWVEANADSLREDLGIGRHFGERWGGGIQRGYGLDKDDKRFSLFNTDKWHDASLRFSTPGLGVVPILYKGPFDQDEIDGSLKDLRMFGSKAANGYQNPEGIIVFHTAANSMFKVLLENDDIPKSLVGA